MGMMSHDIGHLFRPQAAKPNPSALLPPRTVKTYEFHLPMHHIKEEGTGDKSGRAHRVNRNMSHRKTGFNIRAKDDISSQMIDDATYHDLQNSVQILPQKDHLSKDGSSRFRKQMVISRRSQKFFQSQAVIVERQARTGEVHHSIEMKPL